MAGNIKRQQGHNIRSCNKIPVYRAPAMCRDYGHVSSIHPNNAVMLSMLCSDEETEPLCPMTEKVVGARVPDHSRWGSLAPFPR